MSVAVSSVMSVTGDDGSSRASTAYRTFGVRASCRRSSVYLRAASMLGMMWEDTVLLAAAPVEREPENTRWTLMS